MDAITARAIIPSFAYADAPRALAFLCDALGFEKHAVYEGANGTIDHAQLKLGNAFIMLGSVKGRADWPSHTPRELGAATGGTYVVLEDDAAVDAHYARALAAGAEILRAPLSPEHGGRDYSVRDTEGYLWNFGSYRPDAAR